MNLLRLLSFFVLTAMVSGCRPSSSSSTSSPPPPLDSGADASTAPIVIPENISPRVMAYAPRGIRFLLGSDGYMRVPSFDSNSAAINMISIQGTLESLRADPYSLTRLVWLQDGKPMVLSRDGLSAHSLCGVEKAKDIAFIFASICIVTMNGALACVDASTQDCSKLENSIKKGNFQRFSTGYGLSGYGVTLFRPFIIDTTGAISLVRVDHSRVIVTPISPPILADEVIGERYRYDDKGGGSPGETCVERNHAFVCADNKTGKTQPMSSVPAGATKLGFIERDLLCYLLEGQVECRELTPLAFSEPSMRAIPDVVEKRRSLVRLTPLPAGMRAVDWMANFPSLAVVTTTGEVWAWHESPNPNASGSWKKSDVWRLYDPH